VPLQALAAALLAALLTREAALLAALHAATTKQQADGKRSHTVLAHERRASLSSNVDSEYACNIRFLSCPETAECQLTRMHGRSSHGCIGKQTTLNH
jgi:hypothetical protein